MTEAEHAEWVEQADRRVQVFVDLMRTGGFDAVRKRLEEIAEDQNKPSLETNSESN